MTHLGYKLPAGTYASTSPALTPFPFPVRLGFVSLSKSLTQYLIFKICLIYLYLIIEGERKGFEFRLLYSEEVRLLFLCEQVSHIPCLGSTSFRKTYLVQDTDYGV